jgi:hypothetical protein
MAMVTDFTVSPCDTGRCLSAPKLLVACLNYLLATVKTVRRHVVTTMNFAGCGIGRQSCGAQRIVRATHTALGTGLSVLLYSHGFAPDLLT